MNNLTKFKMELAGSDCLVFVGNYEVENWRELAAMYEKGVTILPPANIHVMQLI